MAATSAMPTAEAGPALIGVKEVARLLGVSGRHIHRLRDAGGMPAALKLGARTLWRRQELLAWIDAGCPAGRK